MSYTAATMTAWFQKAFRQQDPAPFINAYVNPLVASDLITFEIKKA